MVSLIVDLGGELVTYRDGLPARWQSPIQVLTWPGVKQLCWLDTICYHYTKPPKRRRQKVHNLWHIS